MFFIILCWLIFGVLIISAIYLFALNLTNRDMESGYIGPCLTGGKHGSAAYRSKKLSRFERRVTELAFKTAGKTGKKQIDNDDIDEAFYRALEEELANRQKKTPPFE